jgi:hypothetical protein
MLFCKVIFSDHFLLFYSIKCIYIGIISAVEMEINERLAMLTNQWVARLLQLSMKIFFFYLNKNKLFINIVIFELNKFNNQSQ